VGFGKVEYKLIGTTCNHRTFCADYLVEEVARIETQHSKISSNVTKLTTLILAALNIANENIELKKNHSDLLKDISKRSKNLIRALDAVANIKSLKQVDTRNIQ